MPRQPSLIPHASTVILLRDGADMGPEILMAQRSKTASFMPGAYVFPGGKLDDEDMASALLDRCIGLSARQATQNLGKVNELDDNHGLSLYVAAIRELFEETGVLLASDAAGRPVDLSSPETHRHFEHWRTRMADNSCSFGQMLLEENLQLPITALGPWSHWVTPEIERKRFDTYFFVARFLEGQPWAHDNAELINSCWINPKTALERHLNGQFSLAPPTFLTLEELAKFDTVDEVFAASTERNLAPIMPILKLDRSPITLFLPGHPEYSNSKTLAVTERTCIEMNKDGTWVSK